MLQLNDAVPPPDPAAQPPPITQTIAVSALSTWHAIAIGAVTGFALALGTFLFEKLSKRTGLAGRRR